MQHYFGAKVKMLQANDLVSIILISGIVQKPPFNILDYFWIFSKNIFKFHCMIFTQFNYATCLLYGNVAPFDVPSDVNWVRSNIIDGTTYPVCVWLYHLGRANILNVSQEHASKLTKFQDQTFFFISTILIMHACNSPVAVTLFSIPG